MADTNSPQVTNNQTFCSIIIPTVGRPSLAKSVESVLEQDFRQADFEIIVVNDSGQPLPQESWQMSKRVRIITTQKRERCFARNTGAAIATGIYLCFLDDDDWWLPDTLAHFWTLAQKDPDTAWLYGGIEFVDDENNSLGFMNQSKTGNNFLESMTETWIPIQASLIKADIFFKTGGFDPEFIVTQDIDLVRRVALHHDFVHTDRVVACIRRGTKRKSVTQYSTGWYFIAKGRDNLLKNPDTFSRFYQSIDDSSRQHGFVLQNYLRGLRFNLREHQWSSALGNLGVSFLCLLKSFSHIFSKDYWLAVRHTKPLYHDAISRSSETHEPVTEWLYG